MKEIEYWIWISSLQGLGAVKALALLQMFKEPRTIYFMTEQELKETNFLTAKNIKEILDVQKRERVAEIYSLMVKHNIKLLNIFDERYPNNLKQIYDPPIALYYMGKFQINEFAIAIVGSRRTTNYGAHSAQTLSYQLALRGIHIVSVLS